MTKQNSFAEQIALRCLSTGGHILSSAGSAKLNILIYHRVFSSIDPFQTDVPDTEQFSWQMALLSRYYTVLPLSDALEKLRSGTLPKAAACVTFDDGYADNYLHALPVLQRYQIPATFFIASGFLNGGMMWNDQVLESIRHLDNDHLDLSEFGLDRYSIANQESRLQCSKKLLPIIKYLPPQQRSEVAQALAEKAGDKLPSNLMMSTQQLQQMQAAGMEIGAHTVTHPILSTLSAEQAEQEIAEGREQLESMLANQTSIRYFAYPNGKPGQDYHDEHASIVKKLGFEAAVSTRWDVTDNNADLFQLPRFTPWDKTPIGFASRLLRNRLRPYQ